MKKIIITGGSGFLGTSIIKELLRKGGYTIVVLDIVAPQVQHEQVHFVKKNLLEDFPESYHEPLLMNSHAVIHLSGKNIYGRFTEEHKDLVYRTRVDATYILIDLLRRDEYRPKKLVSASAVGYYGDQPGVVLIESSKRRNYYFLSDVVAKWEQASLHAQDYGIPVTCIRNAHIIGSGGLLKTVASTFRFRVGSILGSGDDHLPWIDIRDLVDLYILAIETDTPFVINGSNGVEDTQESFAHAIGAVKKSWFYLHVYQWMLWLVFGSFAQEMLVDQYVTSEHLHQLSYQPQHRNLAQSVKDHL